jgi:hypothetical protein
MVPFWGWMGALAEGVGSVRAQWRLVPVAGAGLLTAASGALLAIAVNAATGAPVRWFPAVERHPLWWTAGATFGVAGAGLLAWAAERWYESGLRELVPARQRPEPWVVDRPAEVNQIVAAVRRRAGDTVGITTAVQGAGGFGKTTVAKLVRCDRRVLRRYRRRVYWVTLGRDAGKETLPGLVNDLIRQIDTHGAVTFTSAQQAGEHLAAILAKGKRRLIILDDVWTSEQLAAFPVAGQCARLITTRVPSLTEGAAIPVRVDQMTDKQARALLHGLTPLPAEVESGLLEETGQWPLLLQLANKILADQAKLGGDISPAAEDLLRQLRINGALAADEATGEANRQLDVSDPVQRNKAVRATIEASTGLLTTAEHARLAELAAFAEDEIIPLALITDLWHATARISRLVAGQLVTRLADLALLSLAPGDEAITMHDVIRDYLRKGLGVVRLAQLESALLDSASDGLPRVPAASGHGTVIAWWDLPAQARYLRDHLIEHLLAAGRHQEATMVATDLRWAAARLNQAGPAAPYADLTQVGTPPALRLARLLSQNAHLLAPTDPPHSLTDILCGRASHDPHWEPQATVLTADRKLPALSYVWPPPDLPASTLRRTLTGHTDTVTTRLPRTAPGWPPQAPTRACASGTPAPDSSARSSAAPGT